MLIIMAGLPASGKSAIAQRLKTTIGAVLLDKDSVRAFLFSGFVDYQREQDDLCVDVMYEVANYHFSTRPGSTVILDGRTYSRKYQVDSALKAAALAGVELRIIECVCSEESARKRLEYDQGRHVAKDRNFELYKKSLAGQEAITQMKYVIDTDLFSESESAAMAVTYLTNIGNCQ